MHVVFFTIEDVSSGLFRTQVLDLARSISFLDPTIAIRILVINRPWKFLSHQIALKHYRQLLSSSNVSLTYIPLLPPLRGAVSKPLVSEFLVSLLRIFSALTSLHKRVDVWHARGYWTTMALQRNKNKNILFDPRSLWIFENLSAGNLKQESKPVDYWLRNEELITESSRYVTVVSTGMRDYYNLHYNNNNIGVIPISASEVFFRFNEAVRLKRRQLLNWNEKVIFVYSGSLGLSGINVNSLIDLFRYILSLRDARLLILSNEPEDKIQSLLTTISANQSQYTVIRPQHEEIAEWLTAADIGLHSLPSQLDSNTRLGTKVVEYWSTGLPVIVNNHVGAACEYIEQYKYLGKVVNFENELPNVETLVNEVSEFPRALIQSFALENFSGRVIAKKYSEIYGYIYSERLLSNICD